MRVGLTEEKFKDHGCTAGDGKMMAVELLRQLSAASQRVLAPYCGYKHESAAGKQLKAFRLRLKEGTSFAEKFETLKHKTSK